jgi:hypothetical protein
MPHHVRERRPEVSAMSHHRHALDRRPGVLPEIRTDLRSLTFSMQPTGIRTAPRLVIRCDDDGEVWVSIVSSSSSFPGAVRSID